MDGFAGIVGTTVEELEQSLALMEDSIPYGAYCRVELCTEGVPTPEGLAQLHLNIYESGHHSSYPQVQVIDGIAVTSFNLKKGSPQWQLLIPIIVPVLTIGLITFGIFRIQSIVNSVLPVLIVAGLIVLGVVIVMAKPAERVATAYIGAGKPKLLPAVKDRGRIDWMPRLGKWRVIVYQGTKDVKLNDYDTREQAAQALQNYIVAGKPKLLAATIPLEAATTPKYFTTNPPIQIEEKGIVYGIHMTMEKRYEAEEEARGLRDHGDKTIIKPWEGGYAIYRSEFEADNERHYISDSGIPADKIILNSPKLIVKNLDALPRGTGAKYLIVIRGQGEDLVAKQWARVMPQSLKDNELLIDMSPTSKLPETYQAQNELREDVSELWKRACEWENIPSDSKFVAFSDNNPFILQYRDAVGRLLRMQQLQRGAWQPSVAERVLTFAGYKEGQLRWSGIFQDKTLTVLVKDFFAQPKTIIEYALRPSRMIVSNIVTNHDILFAGAQGNEVWWLVTTNDQTIELHLTDIQLLGERALEDIFANSTAVIIEQPTMAMQPATKKSSFVQVGDRVRFLPRGTGSKYRQEDWPKDVWLGDKEVDGTVSKYKPELPEVTIRGTKIEGISAWAVVKWDNGAHSAIDSEDEGTRWIKLNRTLNLPATKPYDPLEYAKYVLSSNMFQEDELPLYKGETGLNPQGVPDAIWQQALMSLGGNFVKLGDLYTISGVGIEEPPNMRKKPDWVADSAEYMAETIESTGWRDKIDQAFQEAVTRVKGS